ncbi:MAG: glutamate-1-semialdehyde 2,1-aminomutase [bacterium]|nr:glutamate-1-semialdehyde 2,1-aminomutase [bacterium]
MLNSYEKSRALFEKAATLIPGGVNSPVRAFKQVGGNPVYFKNAAGSQIEDADGNTYVDFCNSWGPLILGHSHPEVVEAVREAATRGLSYGAVHEGEIQLAETVLSAFPTFDRARFVSSGTEAVMTALRVARGATGRDIVIKFDGGYHGHFDGMLVKAGSGLATFALAGSEGIPKTIAETTIVLPFDDEDALREVFEKHGDSIAAVIIEPLPANNGLLEQRKEFLKYLREITSNYGSLLIFDEVISGFRLQFGAYWQMIDIEPDIFTLGKIIGGGMPVGALVGKAETMDQLSPVGGIYQAGTLSGNPVSLAAGMATLNILKSQSPYAKMDELGRYFVDRLEESGIPYARAKQVGSIVWLYFDESEFPRTAAGISRAAMDRFTKMYWNLLDNGHYLPPSSYEVLFLSAAHTREHVDALAETITNELKK